MKKYLIYAGVNGAGKSTLYYSSPHEDIPRINTDEMVRQMGNWEDSNLQMKAGSMAVKKIKEYFKKGISFNQETTLCGHSIMNNIQRAKSLGYIVEMHYVGLANVQLAKERVAMRVKKGGHGIPDDVIEKRYDLSIENLKKAIPLCEKVIVYDNSNDFIKIGKFEKGNILWVNESVEAEWFKVNVLEKLNCERLNSFNELCDKSDKKTTFDSPQPKKKMSLKSAVNHKKEVVEQRQADKQPQNPHKSSEYER